MITMQEAAILAEGELRRRFGDNFRSFISHSDKRYQFYRHCNVLIDVMDRVARGELKRLMIFVPPRHSKSETASRLFPAHYLFKHPEHHVGLTSYSAELAFSLSRDARQNYELTGRKLSEDASSVREWHTARGGVFWSAGVGGSITGKGFHLGIIDDPVKNREEAFSQTIRDSNWNWYQTTFYTRAEPDAALIVIQTRWHEDDLSGRLLAAEKESPEHWHIVNLQAIRDDNLIAIPDTCTVEPDWRDDGQALCPERYDVVTLSRIRKTVGESAWNSLYQQNPVADGGSIWKREWFNVFDDEPYLENVGIDWDTAYTKDEENAATAYVKSGVSADGNIYVTDLNWKWCEFPDAVRWMQSMNDVHYVEAKASGKSIVQMLQKVGTTAIEVKVKGGDKVARTQIATPMVESGKVFIRRDLLHRLLDDERQGILNFPLGTHADLNDAFVQALNRLYPFVVEAEKRPEYKSFDEYVDAEIFAPIHEATIKTKKVF